MSFFSKAITSRLSSLQITSSSSSTVPSTASTKSAWRTRRTYGKSLSIANVCLTFVVALADDQLRLVQSILSGDENESFGTIGDQPITRKDIRTLRGLTWLNDEVRLPFICISLNVNSMFFSQ